MEIAKDLQVNEEIRDSVVLLIGENGPLGTMSSREALSIAIDHHLDLVKISPNANPPVCKLMDYGKYCFEKKKKEKDAKKKQHVVELKEIRLSAKIDIGDLETKSRRAKKFISDGNKVKICLKLRGREVNNPSLGSDVINRFCGLCSDFASPEGKFSQEGKQMFLILSKKKIEDKTEDKSLSREQANLEDQAGLEERTNLESQTRSEKTKSSISYEDLNGENSIKNSPKQPN
jgi:translation initiation factor IF-3